MVLEDQIEPRSFRHLGHINAAKTKPRQQVHDADVGFFGYQQVDYLLIPVSAIRHSPGFIQFLFCFRRCDSQRRMGQFERSKV